MAIASLFVSEGSQAVRLPDEFKFDGDEVEIFRRGDEVVLRQKRHGLARAFELITMLPPEIDDRNHLPPRCEAIFDRALPARHQYGNPYPVAPADRDAGKVRGASRWDGGALRYYLQ